jgi:hypothetical protein
MRIVDRLFGRASTLGAQAPGQLTPAPWAPPRCPGNPGKTLAGRLELTNSQRSWTESFHLISIAGGVLRARGHEVVEHATWLEFRPSGFILQPLLVEIHLLEKGGMQTLTTIDTWHPELIKAGLFEYQHSTGDDVVESLTRGFEGWESVDLPVLLDSLRQKPERCTLWEMTFPAKDGAPARTRRAVLGNVAYFAEHPPAAVATTCDEGAQGECEHPFCNCCSLTRNFEALRSQIEADGCFGIRFYAMRDKDGKPGADCRINGEDHGAGMEALRSYVATWPGTGFQFRKQYVFLHTVAVERS